MRIDIAHELYWDEHQFVDILWGEMKRAADKHGWDQTPVNPEMSLEEKFIILTEEIGEVAELTESDALFIKHLTAKLGTLARSLTYDEASKENMKKELLQVTAMAGMAYMSMMTAPSEMVPSG